MKSRFADFRVWLLLFLFPVGVFALLVISAFLKQPRGDSGFGRFYGLMTASPIYDGINGTLWVVMDGKSPASWRWKAPANYQYSSLNFEWQWFPNTIGEPSMGSGRIDTETMMFITPDLSTKVSRESLSELLLGGSFDKLHLEDAEAIEWLFQFIAAAEQGKLPKPRHHLHELDNPMTGSLAHFSLGLRFPYSVCWWTGIWIVLCGWFIWLRPVSNKKIIREDSSSEQAESISRNSRAAP